MRRANRGAVGQVRYRATERAQSEIRALYTICTQSVHDPHTIRTRCVHNGLTLEGRPYPAGPARVASCAGSPYRAVTVDSCRCQIRSGLPVRGKKNATVGMGPRSPAVRGRRTGRNKNARAMGPGPAREKRTATAAMGFRSHAARRRRTGWSKDAQATGWGPARRAALRRGPKDSAVLRTIEVVRCEWTVPWRAVWKSAVAVARALAPAPGQWWPAVAFASPLGAR